MLIFFSESLRSTVLLCEVENVFSVLFSFPTVLFRLFPVFFTRNESVSPNRLWAPLFLKLVCYCKIGRLCELICDQLFFLFQQNSCFSLSFIGIEKLFALTRITYANLSDMKSMNSVADTPWSFPKHLLAFLSPDHRI